MIIFLAVIIVLTAGFLVTGIVRDSAKLVGTSLALDLVGVITLITGPLV